MKLYSKISAIIFSVIIMSVTFSERLSAQNYLARQLSFADKLFSEELYFEAITEYKRLMFFDKDKIHDFRCNFNIGLCYKYGGFYDNAIVYFKQAELSTIIDEDIFQSRIQVARCNILRKTTSVALSILNDLEHETRFADKKEDIYYWRGWALMVADDWENASRSFYYIDPEHPLKLLCDNVEGNKYSVTFAKVISYILPGSGQFYSGNYLSGFMSLGWNLWLGFLTVNSFVEDRIFDGLVIGNLLWLRFYRGNVQNAENFVLQENINIANNAYKFLQNNFTGEKP
ncbi:MAG: hypothetical protein JW995_10205 [Melioribacteraceae bacterium]|nr:hypothetical protein [Melioribacteraceae bacterium]